MNLGFAHPQRLASLDHNGLTYLQDYQMGLNPNAPNGDTNGNGVSDVEEIAQGTDPKATTITLMKSSVFVGVANSSDSGAQPFANYTLPEPPAAWQGLEVSKLIVFEFAGTGDQAGRVVDDYAAIASSPPREFVRLSGGPFLVSNLTYNVTSLWNTNATAHTLVAGSDSPSLQYLSSFHVEFTTPIPKMEITVDANRDGRIEFGTNSVDHTTSTNAFRFWINDDCDASGNDVAGGTADSVSDTIVNQRDLEDFTRLEIKVGTDVKVLVESGYKLVIEMTGGLQVKLFRAPQSGDGYLKDSFQAMVQISPSFNKLVDLNNLSASIDANEYGETPIPFIFEGVTSGNGTIRLALKNPQGQVVSSSKVHLKLQNIKEMYERADAVWDNTDYPHNYSGSLPEPIVTLSTGNFTPPPDETKQAIVFVHGWNMSPVGADVFAQTMFKRSWQRGFKGRFASMRWPTFYSSTFNQVPVAGEAVDAYLAKYNDSEYRAWKCGRALKTFVESLPSDYARNLVAHSMGNIVAGSALREGLMVDNYALLQGAVPAICYDENVARPAQMTRSYAGMNVTLWDNTTPCDDADAGTRALTYRGQLSNVSGNLFNFYLPNDAATVYAWEFNNDQFKPMRFNLGTSGYFYDPLTEPGFRLGITFAIMPSRFVRTAHEAMAYVGGSPTKVVGAEGRTGGKIGGSVDLSSPSFGGQNGFNTEHSAEFNRNIQQLKTFYDQLLMKFQITPNP